MELNDFKKRDLNISNESLAELEQRVYAEIFKLETQRKFQRKIRLSVISSAAAVLIIILTTLFFRNYISQETPANTNLIFAENSIPSDINLCSQDLDEVYFEDYIDDVYEYYY